VGLSDESNAGAQGGASAADRAAAEEALFIKATRLAAPLPVTFEPLAKVNFWDQSASERLAEVVDLLKFTSANHQDPQQSVLAYAARMRKWSSADRIIAISRRGLEAPRVRVTRSSTWSKDVDPWREVDQLPVFDGGLLSELIHAGEPTIINAVDIKPYDPAHEYLHGMKSVMALPTWDGGEALNMVVQMSSRTDAFKVDRLPEMLWISNLFGRLTKNLVLGRQVKEAYDALDRELKSVADIQMSLLPQENPTLSTMEVATHYQSSTRAGGDYYDFFDLGDGKWGVLIADVSGHGTPAAVLMAILHAIAHVTPMQALEPHEALEFINRAMTKRYTLDSGAFVTMIYAIYDEKARTLRFANAGHPRPLVHETDGRVRELGGDIGGVPLGILGEVEYETTQVQLTPGQAVVLYTDGFTEAFGPARELFGEARFKEAIRAGALMGDRSASSILSKILEDVGGFSGLTNRSDDRTLIVGMVK
jgi:sigma-B regulation protein RsbU (phosphoserine phosphatase)